MEHSFLKTSFKGGESRLGVIDDSKMSGCVTTDFWALTSELGRPADFRFDNDDEKKE